MKFPDTPDPASPGQAARWRLREAAPADASEIERLVRELATYERAPDEVVATATDFEEALFGGQPLVHCLVAEVDGADPGGEPEVAGIAVWFVTFSTWRGRHGVWLEDLFVSPEHRGLGLGRALLARLAAMAIERGYERVEWNVLDWNEPALGFYRRLGAEALDAWTVHRLSGEALRELAASASRFVAVGNQSTANRDALPRTKGGVA
jgi:GNAT superfamily N-acetyltransferase